MMVVEWCVCDLMFTLNTLGWLHPMRNDFWIGIKRSNRLKDIRNPYIDIHPYLGDCRGQSHLVVSTIKD